MILFATLIGSFVLLVTLTPSSPQPAQAQAPTPVATVSFSGPDNQPLQPCRLDLGINCDFARLVQAAQLSAAPRYNPPVDARDVPTHTLISTTFAEPMNAQTINIRTFYVTQRETRIEGHVDYLPSHRMAVFYPARPLIANTHYTATLTAVAQTLAGEPLPETRVWHFTTAAADSRFGQVVNVGPVQGAAAQTPMQVYFGDLHAHTGYSGGVGTPTQAFAGARAGGLDFYAVTEHDTLTDPNEWQAVLDLAEAVTIEGEFIGLRGFEYTNPVSGHMNAFETETYVSTNDPAYNELSEFYEWLLAQPAAIGQFNHPWPDFNFNDFAYHPQIDLTVTLREIISADQFFLSLDSGWHVGTLLNTDTHTDDWGCCRRMGLIAPNLTRQNVLDAMRARRTFYVSPFGANVAVVMQANGYWMGAALPNPSTLNFTVTVYDSNSSSDSLTLKLYEGNVPIASVRLPGSAVYTWSPTVSAKPGAYYFIEAYYDDWLIPAYSSPIWVEQAPVAEAGPVQIVGPGQTVTLDGRNSQDPDGDALTYRWRQETGPSITLNQANTAQPTFTPPQNAGEINLRLTVVDPGDLSHSDTTTVIITDKPLLEITKSGPDSADPGELITYTLTVTNNGLTDASGVVITDVLPTGASYVSGGTLTPENIVTWNVPSLPANGGSVQVTFTVTTDQGIVNTDYGATCPDCIPAYGTIWVFTNGHRTYMPAIRK